MSPQDKSGSDKPRASEETQRSGEQNDRGRSGEGAASALRHMISQDDHQRHQNGEADDAAGHAQ